MASLTIKLNNQWTRFSREHAHLEFLGTVEQQASIGALARSTDGAYFQINGDVERKLNTSRVEAALRAAGQAPKRKPAPRAAAQRPASTAPAPTVIVKRRRVVAIPPTA